MNKPLIITPHAREAMQLRRVTKDDLLDVLAHPEITDRSSRDVVRYFKGQLCVVVSDEGRSSIRIKTVLYRYGQKWTDEDVRNRDLLR